MFRRVVWWCAAVSVVNGRFSNVSEVSLFTAPFLTRESPEFVLGGMFPLTLLSTGAGADDGIQQMEAFRYEIDVLNREKALGSMSIGYKVYDTQSVESTTLAQSRSLIQNNITAGIGLEWTDILASDLLSGYNVTFVTYSRTINQRFMYSDPPLFAVSTPPTSEYVNGVLALAQKMNWTLLTFLFTNDIFSAYVQLFGNTFHRGGYNVTCSKLIPFIQTDEDIETIQPIVDDFVSCISDSQSNVIVLGMDSFNAANIIRNVRASDNTKDKIFVLSTVVHNLLLSSNNFINTAGPYGVSTKMLEGSVFITPTLGDNSGFREYFSRLNPENTRYPQFKTYWENIFMCNYHPNSTEPECSKEWKDRSLPAKCRCTGNETLADLQLDVLVGYVQDSVYTVVNGLKTILHDCSALTSEDFCGPDQIDGRMIFRAAQELSFQGATGPVSYREATRLGGSMELFVVRENKRLEKLGQFSSAMGINVNETVMSTLPISHVFPRYVRFTSSGGLAVVISAGIAILISLGMMTYFYVNRNKDELRRLSPFFYQLMLIGMVMICAGLILWTGKPNKIQCTVKIWISIIGFVLIITTLLGKTYRIWRIFNNIRVGEAGISDKTLFKFTGGVLVFEIILLAVYTFTFSIPGPHIVLVDSTGLDQYYSCSTGNTTVDNVFGGIFLGINMFLVLCAGFLAYRIKNVDSAYNESKDIGLVVFVYLVFGFVTIPIYYTNGNTVDSYSETYTTRSVATLLLILFTIGFLFGPKVYATQRYFGHSKRKAKSTSTDSLIVDVPRIPENNEKHLVRSRFLTGSLWEK